jgi:acylphosphatase
METPFKSVSIKIIGLVQGVGFRAGLERAAKELKLVGTVRNEVDGSVYAEVEGPMSNIEKLVAWCHKGPRFAKVTEVKVQDVPRRDFTEFQILRW